LDERSAKLRDVLARIGESMERVSLRVFELVPLLQRNARACFDRAARVFGDPRSIGAGLDAFDVRDRREDLLAKPSFRRWVERGARLFPQRLPGRERRTQPREIELSAHVERNELEAVTFERPHASMVRWQAARAREA